MKSFIQFIKEADTTLRSPYTDWGFLGRARGENARNRDAWTDQALAAGDGKELDQMKAAYDARKKYPHIKTVHPVDPSDPHAAWNNDEDPMGQGLSDEEIASANKKYEDAVRRHAQTVPQKANATSGRETKAASYDTLAQSLGYDSVTAALEKGLVKYIIGGGGTVTQLTAKDTPRTHQVIIDYLQGNTAIKGVVLVDFLNKSHLDKVEFADREQAIETLKGAASTKSTPTMTIKGQSYKVMGQHSDKKHVGWVHYVLQARDGKYWGLSKSEEGRESDLIALAERSVVPPESVDTTWGDGWS